MNIFTELFRFFISLGSSEITCVFEADSEYKNDYTVIGVPLTLYFLCLLCVYECLAACLCTGVWLVSVGIRRGQQVL